MTDKEKELIKKRLREVLFLLDGEGENNGDVISNEQAQEESKRDIVDKSKDNSTLPKR